MQNRSEDKLKFESDLLMKKERNLCTKCDAFRLPPPCKCRTVGGGSGKSGGKNSDVKLKSNEQKQDRHQPIQDLIQRLKNHPYWKKDSLENVFRFKKEDALVLLVLDLENGSIELTSKFLVAEDQKYSVKELFEMFANEFNQFKNDMKEQNINVNQFKMDDSIADKLIIKIPNKNYFDRFIEQLNNNDLLPIKNYPALTENMKTNAMPQEENKHFHPVPRPKGILVS